MPPAARLPAPDTAALLLLPLSVLAGGALFWPAACLAAIGAALERRHLAMLVWYGLAIGFDAQALLIAPFFVALLIQRRVPLALLPAAPLLAVATLAVRAIGAPFPPELVLPQDLTLAAGAPTLWSVAQVLPWLGELPLTGLALCLATGTAAAYAAWFSVRPLSDRGLPGAALLCALAIPLALPAVGPDAFLLAVALAALLALRQRDVAGWHLAGLVAAGTGLAYADAALAPLGGLALLAATALHARAVLKPAANDNPLLARTA